MLLQQAKQNATNAVKTKLAECSHEVQICKGLSLKRAIIPSLMLIFGLFPIVLIVIVATTGDLSYVKQTHSCLSFLLQTRALGWTYKHIANLVSNI
jgi:nitrate reductase NapE component